MTAPRTLFGKIWDAHVIMQKPDGDALLHIDRNFVHEGSFHAFGALAKEGRKVRKPRQNFAVADHYVPTVGRDQGLAAVEDDDARHMIGLLEENCRVNGIVHYGMADDRQGIVHVIGPELGITQPGLLLVCGYSCCAVRAGARGLPIPPAGGGEEGEGRARAAGT